MTKNLKILMLLAILLAVSASIILFMGYQQRNSTAVFPFGPRTTRFNPADIELFYVARTVFSSINIVLLIVLIINYFSIYLKTKSEFTIGLLFFSVFFLIKDLTWSPFVIGWFGFGLFGLGPFAFLPDLFELVALSVLLYMSVEY